MTITAQLAEALRYMVEVREITCAHNHPPPDGFCAKCKADKALAAYDAVKDTPADVAEVVGELNEYSALLERGEHYTDDASKVMRRAASLLSRLSEQDDAMVERAAKLLCEAGGLRKFKVLEDGPREYWLRLTRSALRAAWGGNK